jgi:Carboxypeptidase regulatory-like domain
MNVLFIDCFAVVRVSRQVNQFGRKVKMRDQNSVKSLREFFAVGVLSVTVFLFLSLSLAAQVVTGSISGTVTDQTGAVVDGATIILTNESTNATQKAASSASGTFRFSFLPVGHYTVDVSKEGFRKIRMQGASVDANNETALGALKLQLGATTESVDVTAAPPLVESAQAQVTAAVSGEALQTFAGTGENEGLDFIALTLPGVGATRDANFSNTNGVGFSVNGIRGRNNDQQIDGENNNDNSVTGPAVFMSDPDFVSEYQATTSNFGPEYGRNSGSVINVVTKSGTNNWHGTVFGQETNSIFTTLTNTEKDFLGITEPPRFNQEFSGGSVGGPLRKDRVFVFGGFDNQIFSSKITDISEGVTPTPLGLSQLAACFPGSASIAALQAYGPYGVGAGSPTPNGTPATVVTQSGSGCTYQQAPVQRTVPDGIHFFDFISKLDIHATNSDSISMRYFFQKQIFFNDEISAGAEALGYPANIPSLGQSSLVDYTHTFSNRFLNEFRFGYTRNNVQFGGNTLGTVPTISEVSQALTSVAFQSSSLAGYGPTSVVPDGRIVSTYQLQDNVSFTWKQHQLKWGANITNQRSPNVFLPGFNGAFSYGGPDFGQYATNQPASAEVVVGNPNFDFKEWDTFFYVGDDWKVRSNLTLNLGLTYSYLGQPANLFHSETLARQTGSDPLWNPNLPLSATTEPAVGTLHDLFGPSIGFAWSPNGWLTGNGKTVLRGGYRLTYDPAFYNIFLSNATSAPVVLNQTFTPTTPTVFTPPGVTAAPFGPSIRAEYASLLPIGQLDPRSTPEIISPPTLRPDKVHEWSFGIQREISSHAAVEVRYVGNHGEDLFQTANANPYVQGLATSFPNLLPAGVTPCPQASAVVTNAIGRVNCNMGLELQVKNTGFSNYQGLQAEFRTTSLFKQLTMRTNYTWSKTLDNTTDIFNTFAAGNSETLAQNPLNTQGGEYGISGLNYPSTWNVTFVEDLPFLRGHNNLMGRLLGGWQLSGTYTLQSGQPYTPTQEFVNSGSYPATGQVEDTNFNLSLNNGVPDVVRPFVSNPGAPVNQVGIYAGDVCNAFGIAAACPVTPQNPVGLPANTLLSMNAINATGSLTPVTNSQVRFVANGAESDSIYGTPFGTAGRNILRDYHTNIGSFSVYKNFKFSERASVQLHTTMNNVFNHQNFGNVSPGINPFIENAGNTNYELGFATPQLMPNASLSCPAGVRCIFFGVKVIY